MDLSKITIQSARKMLDTREVTVRDLVESYLKNIEAKNKELYVYLEVYMDVMEQADRAQAMIDRGESKDLTGIPIAIKDNILVKGKRASAASKILENYKATYTSTAAQKLIDQGAILLGRVNMDEFAMGGSTENSAYGPTRNPYDSERVAGGSSGGSAAAVAADMALASLGSDTGGSVREPSAFCGVVGLKPTYGGVSRHGLMAMGSSLDVIGPIGKTVADTEIVFNVIKGRDGMDSTSIEIENSKLKIENLKIGVPKGLMNQEGLSPEVKKNFNESVEKLKGLGYEIEEAEMPNLDKALAVYYILMPAEVSSNMARYDGMRYGERVDGSPPAGGLLEVYKKTRGQKLGKEVRRRIILGTYVLSTGYYDAYYGKALAVRKVLQEEFKKAFEKVDLILTPTAPSVAWKVGEKTSPLENYLADVFTISANIVGVPAISIPSGSSEVEGNNLPLGIQFMAPHLCENTLFQIGKSFLGEK